MKHRIQQPMHSQIARQAAGAAAFCRVVSAIAVSAAAHNLLAQQITLQRYVSISGTVESVAAGAMVLLDDQGNRHEVQIVEHGEQTVPLKQAGVLLKFPAEVRVSGEYGVESLKRGSLVQFPTRINRAGQSDGAIDQLTLLEDSRQSPSVAATDESPSRSDRSSGQTTALEYVAVTVTGAIDRLVGNRLTVTVGKNVVTHREKIAFNVAKDAAVRMESADYRRAEAGDRVARARVAVFDSGDRVIQRIEIEKQSRKSNATDSEAALLAKYRRLSDEPGPVRVERSRHFLLHTDVSPRSAAVLLEKLETMIGLVSGYYGHPPRQIIECYVVRELAHWPPTTFDAAAAHSITSGAGVTQSLSLGRQARAIVYACDDHGTVQHEAVHAYCSQTFGDTGPVWYAEGMAEMGNYWKRDLRAVSIPAVAVHYLRTSPPKSMAEIVAAGQITGDSWEAYQWRWALCYVLANNPNYSRHFKGLGIGLMTGAAGASFESVYGNVAPQIAFEYEQFLANLDNGYRVDLAAWQWDRKWAPLQVGRRAAAKVEAARGWQATGATLQERQAYDFVAEGAWRVRPELPESSADGNADGSGRLIGVLMHDFRLSEPFELGARGSFVAPASGDLYVRCRDGWNLLADNEGQITLHVRTATTP
jgi:hypothetical protein